MSLDISNAEYLVHDRYPLLRVTIAGRVALLDAEPKPTVHRAGLVYLGGDFADLFPPVTLDPDGTGGTEIEGATSDRRVFALYDAFLRAATSGDFRPGPVAIPGGD